MAGVVIPALGYATDDVIVLQWHKAPGDPVAAGEMLVDIEAEKSVSTIEAGETGVLLAVYAPAGAVVAEGATVGWIGAASEAAPVVELDVLGWAEDLGPIPRELAGHVPTGRLLPAAARDAGEPPGKASRARLRNFLKGLLRQITATRMARSWVAAPKVDLFADIDFSRVVAHRQARKDAGHDAPSFNVYIAHAVVQAFADLPHLNLNWIDGQATPLEQVSVGVAVALEDSLLTISMKHLGGASLDEIQHRFKALIRKALAMSLRRDEMYGNSLTVTNLGEFEVSSFSAIINPPEIFILAIGKLDERVVMRNGVPTAVPYSRFCLSFDHRGVDGAPASKLLRQIKTHLEHYGEA
ncbi:MAG: 2-oxo acid dehydrogenase subunit E2 [Candidatus Lambdaproteobacteria bacterium]|nr:2-oxo acid dehydrogenase subunit E2 [Candidatus Lambdaproteobacteria bacterium]